MKAKQAAPKQDVLDVGALLGVPEDEQLAQTDGGAIRDFVKGLTGFFLTATAMEKAAVNKLATAKQLIPPTTSQADEVIQKFIQGTTADRKQVEAHWGICAIVHRFHRRLTAKRDIAVQALTDANAIGNRLHNGYTEMANRRAEQAEREAREREEFLARQERDQELARLEADAVEREESSPDLSDREESFVGFFVGGSGGVAGNGQRAAQAAGYSDALKSSARLLSSVKIQMAIKAKQGAAEIRRQAVVRAAEPITVHVDEVKPDITRAGGSYDCTTESAEIIDPDALRQAYLSGKYGLPLDLMDPSQKVCNALAKSMGPRLNTIPGLRYKSTTKVV